MNALDTLIQQAQADLDLKNTAATKAAVYLTGLTDARDILAAQAEVKPETLVPAPKRRGRKPRPLGWSASTDVTGLVTVTPPAPEAHPERPAFLDRKVTA